MNKTKRVKISKRPNSIAIIKTHLLESLIEEKLAATSPKPGPRLLIQAATAVKAEILSIPLANSNNIQITNTAAYAEKKPQIASITRSGNTLRPNLILNTARG